jgi:hypothetical protein
VSTTSRTILGYALLAAWLTLATGLWPLPAQKTELLVAHAKLTLADTPRVDCEKRDGSSWNKSRCQLEAWVKNPSDLEATFWAEWIVNLFVMAGGIGASLMMRRGIRFWSLAVLLTSLLYFWRQNFPVTIYHLLFREVASLEQFIARLGIYAKHPGVSLTMLYYDFLMPLLLVAACVLAVRSYSQGRGLGSAAT